jgi:hypothetical protein
MSLKPKKNKTKSNVPTSVKKNQKISRKVADIVYDAMPREEVEGISRHEFHLGLNIEMEHYDVTSGNLKKTAQITLAHLQELPDYNTRLIKMEKEGEKELKKAKPKWIRKIKDTKTGKEHEIQKVYGPMPSGVSFGRTFDRFGGHKINGEPVEFWLDTTWGGWYHFMYKGIHYKLEVLDFGNLPKLDLEIMEVK